MIKLISNELQIGMKDKEIGVSGDHNFLTKTIAVPRILDGHCLDDYTFVLLVSHSNTNKTFEDYLSKEILDDNIILTWVIQRHDVEFPGEVKVTLKFYNSETIKQSDVASFIVKEGISPPLPDENSQSIFDQAVADATKQAEKAKTEAIRAVSAAELTLKMYEEIKTLYETNEKGGGA